MLRTNSKKVRDKVNNYILSICYLDELEKANADKPITSVYNDFCICYWKHQQMQRYYHYNIYEAFKSWMYGLPTSFNIDFAYYDQRQLLKKWLEETDEEANKYDDEKVEKLFNHLVINQFFKMLEKESK